MRNYLLAALLCAVLLSVGWLSLSGIPLLVALVPLLWVSGTMDNSKRSFRRTAGWMSLAFGLWSCVTTWWIWYAVAVGAILSVIITILLFGGTFMLFHYVSKRSPRILAYFILVAGWITFEYIYLNGDVSFPWLMLGNGFANDVWAIQWYEYTGGFGGTLWVLLSNILIYEALTGKKAVKWVAAGAVVVIPLVISLVMYCRYEEPSEKVKITVIQPNIDPYNEKFHTNIDNQIANLIDLIGNSPKDVDFVVMPETALHEGLMEDALEFSVQLDHFRDVAKEYPGTHFIIGASTYRVYQQGEKISKTACQIRGENLWYDNYNSALAIDSTKNTQVHHKSKLVIGAELTPSWIPQVLIDKIIDLSGTGPGNCGLDTVRVVFTSPKGLRSSAPICYESVYGEYFTEFARNGAQVIFVITNDGWWHDTAGHRQHFSFSRLRAIETRRSIARSANTGISGFINQRGDTFQKIGWDVRSTETREMALNNNMTFYVKHGDYIARGAVTLFLISLLYYPFFRIMRRRKNQVK